MSVLRKPRSDSKLAALPEDQRQALVNWLLACNPYRVVKQRLAAEYGVTTSDAALSAFWEENCSAAMITRRERAVSLADDMADEAAKRPGQFDAATIDALKQKAFELAVNPQADPRDVKSLFMLVLKAADQDMERRKFEQQVKDDYDLVLDQFVEDAKGDSVASGILLKLRDRMAEVRAKRAA
jgi:hypothetical protein